jgi:hypothetical protein
MTTHSRTARFATRRSILEIKIPMPRAAAAPGDGWTVVMLRVVVKDESRDDGGTGEEE